MFQNIFTSGHVFSENDDELRLKYILFNALILFNIFVVSIAATMRMFNAQYIQGLVDIIYILCAFIAFMVARYSRASLNALMYFVIFYSYSVVTFLFYYSLHPLIGTAWYILVLMISFVFKGRVTAMIIFLISLISMVLISKLHYHYTFSEIFLGLLPYTAVIFFLYIFDTQNENLKSMIKQQRSRYKYLSQHDTLTGIPNRAFFFNKLKELLHSVQQKKQKIAILFVDLDKFKQINDTLGHQAGDIILKEVASRIQKALDHKGIVTRYGGDEFAIIVEQIEGIGIMKELIHRIFHSMHIPIDINGTPVQITMSIGATIAPDDGTEELTLLTNADKAMYRAKEQTQHKYCFYSELSAETTDTLSH
jgi:diguanylate cyclase (GGDEF)-like protein